MVQIKPSKKQALEVVLGNENCGVRCVSTVVSRQGNNVKHAFLQMSCIMLSPLKDDFILFGKVLNGYHPV